MRTMQQSTHRVLRRERLAVVNISTPVWARFRPGPILSQLFEISTLGPVNRSIIRLLSNELPCVPYLSFGRPRGRL